MILTEGRLEFLLNLMMNDPDWCSKTPEFNRDEVLKGVKVFRDYWMENHTDPICSVCGGDGCTISFSDNMSKLNIDHCETCHATGQVDVVELKPKRVTKLLPDDDTIYSSWRPCNFCDTLGEVRISAGITPRAWGTCPSCEGEGGFYE